jgi:hypothetical protein
MQAKRGLAVLKKGPSVVWLLTGINGALALTLLSVFIFKGGVSFGGTWDGPTIVTVLLTVATLVLAVVALGVGLLAIWGFTTLREHASNVAEKSAGIAADKAVESLMRKWGWEGLDAAKLETAGNEDIANAYGKEG